MKNIVLVGFMGTGKTTIAGALSKKLKMTYVSTDKLIEDKEKTSIREIFSKKGEKYFRKIEKDAVKEASLMKNVVIDAGGGAVIDPENVENLKQNGRVICLWAEAGVILERTRSYAHRPLLNVENPLNEIKELLARRQPFYERADQHIHTSGKAPEEIVRDIERIMRDAENTK
jgi:shikimate kinase